MLEMNGAIVRPSGMLCPFLPREGRDLRLVVDYLTGGRQCGKACELYCHCIGVEGGHFKTYDVIFSIKPDVNCTMISTLENKRY